MNDVRVVVIDGHVIAQYLKGVTGWWTCSKSTNNDEGDFAVWQDTPVNLNKALRLVGNVAIVRSELSPIESPSGWLVNAADRSPKARTPEGYREALRQLARSL